jgi:endo-1,4-beta-D-glucanase Y
MRDFGPGLRAIVIASFIGLMGSLVDGCKAEQSWPLWESYTQHFMDGQGRVIEHSAGDRTTSEGQSYAMFFALVDNDRPRFDKVLHWTETNLAGGDLTARLPAWSWGEAPDGSWKVLDANSASDADLWIAYSLIEAGRLWHDPHYESLGKSVAGRIAQEEVALVPGIGTTLVAGNQGFHPDANTWIINPSYLPLSVLTRLAAAVPDGPWLSVIASLGPVLSRGSGSGYAMDWVVAGSGIRPVSGPADLAAGGRQLPALGSYDAIRVYLWLGLADPATPGRSELLRSVSGMAEYMSSRNVPPAKVDSLGRVVDSAGTIGFSAAIVPYLTAMGMATQAKAQMERVEGAKDAATGMYAAGQDTPRYYDQNLVLFATGWAEQRYRFGSDGTLTLKWK